MWPGADGGSGARLSRATCALNYIPNTGSIIAVIRPLLMAAVQQAPYNALITIGGLTVFEQIFTRVVAVHGRRRMCRPWRQVT